MRRALFALVLVGCGAADQPRVVAFDTPWEDVEPSKERAAGAFTAELDATLPGAGWFEAGDTAGRDASRVTLRDPGGSWPIVHVELLGWSPEGWNRLEWFVGQPGWVAGDVPVDGTAAIGRLTTVDGGVRYLVGGRLHLTEPGLEPGDRVSGWFEDVVVSGAAP